MKAACLLLYMLVLAGNRCFELKQLH